MEWLMRGLWLLRGTPRPVQVEALNRSLLGLANAGTAEETRLPHHPDPARRWAHFLDMRLGKTPLVLNEFLLLRRRDHLTKLLIVCPSRLTAQWCLETANWQTGLPIHRYDWKTKGGQRATQNFIHAGEGVLIVNYDALRTGNGELWLSRWIDDRTMLVLDESAVIKGHASLTFKRAHKLARPAAYVRLLSGLPMPNSVGDLWSQLQVLGLDEPRFAKFTNFRNYFGVQGGHRMRQTVGARTGRQGELRDLLGRFAFRAKRQDWYADSAEPDFEVVNLDLGEPLQQHYDEMFNHLVVSLTDPTALATAAQVITRTVKLQQIASGFVIDDDRTVRTLVPFHASPKLLDLEARLETQLDGKLLVIAHFRHTVRELFYQLDRFTPAIIAGAEEMGRLGREVEAEKARFNADPDCRVLIGQAQALKYGHTLPGSAEDPCLSICFYENSYNLDDRVQCEARPVVADRAHLPLHIWDYCASAIDAAVVQALQRKLRVAQAIMDAVGVPTEEEKNDDE